MKWLMALAAVAVTACGGSSTGPAPVSCIALERNDRNTAAADGSTEIRTASGDHSTLDGNAFTLITWHLLAGGSDTHEYITEPDGSCETPSPPVDTI